MGPVLNVTTYGFKCGKHDLVNCTNIFHKNLAACDQSWCTCEWCYVDPNNCSLLNRHIFFLPNSICYYLYLPCGDMDIFMQDNQIASLEGQRLKIGLNSNSCGCVLRVCFNGHYCTLRKKVNTQILALTLYGYSWMGAYSDDGTHFDGPMQWWRGPVVEFVKEAAYEGGFTLEIAHPPKFLRIKSIEFFNGISEANFCIYATALGFLGMYVCLEVYTHRFAGFDNGFHDYG